MHANGILIISGGLTKSIVLNSLLLAFTWLIRVAGYVDEYVSCFQINTCWVLSSGALLVPPGDYILRALYNGNSIYAASSASSPFNVDRLCLDVALALKA